MFFKEHISFLPPLSVYRRYFREDSAATLVGRNRRLCCILKVTSQSHASVYVHALVTQECCSYRVHSGICFLGLTGNII